MKAVVVVLALVGVVGCGKPAGDGKQVATQNKTMTRTEFEASLKDLKTGNDFIAKFGKPARTSPNNGPNPTLCLVFERITVDTISGKTDSSVLVYVEGNGPDGKYVRHSFSPGH